MFILQVNSSGLPNLGTDFNANDLTAPITVPVMSSHSVTTGIDPVTGRPEARQDSYHSRAGYTSGAHLVATGVSTGVYLCHESAGLGTTFSQAAGLGKLGKGVKVGGGIFAFLGAFLSILDIKNNLDFMSVLEKRKEKIVLKSLEGMNLGEKKEEIKAALRGCNGDYTALKAKLKEIGVNDNGIDAIEEKLKIADTMKGEAKSNAWWSGVSLGLGIAALAVATFCTGGIALAVLGGIALTTAAIEFGAKSDLDGSSNFLKDIFKSNLPGDQEENTMRREVFYSNIQTVVR